MNPNPQHKSMKGIKDQDSPVRPGMGGALPHDPSKEIEKILRTFIGRVNNNPITSNYIWDEDDHNIEEALKALKQAMDKQVIDGRIAEIEYLADETMTWIDMDSMAIADRIEELKNERG